MIWKILHSLLLGTLMGFWVTHTPLMDYPILAGVVLCGFMVGVALSPLATAWLTERFTRPKEAINSEPPLATYLVLHQLVAGMNEIHTMINQEEMSDNVRRRLVASILHTADKVNAMATLGEPD